MFYYKFSTIVNLKNRKAQLLLNKVDSAVLLGKINDERKSLIFIAAVKS